MVLCGLLVGFGLECLVLLYAVTQFQAVPTRDPTDPTSRGACIAGGGPGGHDWSMVLPKSLLEIIRMMTDTSDFYFAGVLGLAHCHGYHHVGFD